LLAAVRQVFATGGGGAPTSNGGGGISGKPAVAAFGGVTGQLMLMLYLNHCLKLCTIVKRISLISVLVHWCDLTRTEIREILLTIMHSFKQFLKLQRRKQSQVFSVIVCITSEQMARHLVTSHVF